MGRLRVGLAMVQATGAMRRNLLVFAAPLVVVDCLNRTLDSAAHHLFPRHAVLVDFPAFLIVCLVGGMFAEVVVARMFFEELDVQRAELTRVAEAVRYPGFLKLVWRLTLRYLGWGFLAGVAGLFVLSFARAIQLGAHGGEHGGRLPHDWIHVGVQVGTVLMSLFFCLYAFALPLFAQRKGAVTDLISESIARVRPMRWLVAVVCAAGQVLALLPYDVEQAIRGHFVLGFGVKALLGAVSTVVIAVIHTWFVMVLAGLMLQTEAPPGEVEGARVFEPVA